MPRIALVCLVLVGGCFFEADYSGGMYTCKDGKCPSGMDCINQVCVGERRDAAIDVPVDTMIDGPLPALTCVEPGMLTSGIPVMGTTESRMNLMWSFCSGGIQNGFDAVYMITTTAPNKQLNVNIAQGQSAYVINACAQMGNTPACLGSNTAVMGNPISVTAAAAGDYWVIVDNLVANASGTYTLTVTVN